MKVWTRWIKRAQINIYFVYIYDSIVLHLIVSEYENLIFIKIMVKSEATQKCSAEIVIDEDVNYHRKDYY